MKRRAEYEKHFDAYSCPADGIGDVCASLLPAYALAEGEAEEPAEIPEIPSEEEIIDIEKVDITSNNTEEVVPEVEILSDVIAEEIIEPVVEEAEEKALGINAPETELVVGETMQLMNAAANGYVASGECGENLTWTLDDKGTLTISGTGDMNNYTFSISTGISVDSPWYEIRNKIINIEIESAVTSIGSYAFYNCSNLKTVSIGNNVTSIDTTAFENSANINSFTVSEGNSIFCSLDGVVYYKSKTKLIVFPSGQTGTFVIPSSVTEIERYSFALCHLSEITIPDKVNKIGEFAFFACHFEEVTLPSALESIEKGLFQKSGIKSIVIPQSVKRIGGLSFFSSALEDVYYNGTKEQWDAISFGSLNEDLLNANIHFFGITSTYTVTYNLNGREGALSVQTKTAVQPHPIFSSPSTVREPLTVRVVPSPQM
ncbi:MAG: leucine-rich repeat domain-containing protein [Eubacteriales bacterium]|nr:leucine-rich repeat domain-containing protein [Eubacteriales bacterium]